MFLSPRSISVNKNTTHLSTQSCKRVLLFTSDANWSCLYIRGGVHSCNAYLPAPAASSTYSTALSTWDQTKLKQPVAVPEWERQLPHTSSLSVHPAEGSLCRGDMSWHVWTQKFIHPWRFPLTSPDTSRLISIFYHNKRKGHHKRVYTVCKGCCDRSTTEPLMMSLVLWNNLICFVSTVYEDDAKPVLKGRNRDI